MLYQCDYINLVVSCTCMQHPRCGAWQDFCLWLLEIQFKNRGFGRATIDKDDLVGVLVQDFLHEFKILYPQRSLTPKMHFMVHMPSWTKR